MGKRWVALRGGIRLGVGGEIRDRPRCWVVGLGNVIGRVWRAIV